MSENRKEKTGYNSLFDRLKKVITKNAEEIPPEASEKTLHGSDNTTTPDPFAETPPTPHTERGILDIPENSLLYSLWLESTAEHTSKETSDDSDDLKQSLDLAMEELDNPQIPIATKELEEEKQYVTVQLMIQSSKRHKQTRPNNLGIVPNVDADIFLYKARQNMAAWILLFPPSGNGKPLTEGQFLFILSEQSITYGLDKEKIKELSEHPVYFKLIPIAFGTPMLPGENGSIVDKFERNPEKTFGTTENGNIDYHSQNQFQSIHKGDIICEAIPPTDGTDGTDITGKRIPATDGKPAKFPAGQNTTIDEEKHQLIASMDGILKFEYEKFNISPVLSIPGNVDLNVGNIDFLGDVNISGDVRDGFIVKATGNITIGGSIEGAIIEAGGNLTVRGGILGDEKAVIKSGGDVRAQYIENSVLYAMGSVQAESIISSYIYSDDRIIVRLGRGTVIGGKLVAANLIDVKVCGCRSQRQTTLTIGEFPYQQQKKEELTLALQKASEEKESLEQTIQILSDPMEDEDPTKMQTAANLRLRQSILSIQVSHLKRLLDDFTDRDLDPKQCRVKLDTVYPFTCISILNYSHTVKDPANDYNFHLGDTGIEIR